VVEDLFLWTVMIGASYGVKHGVHLGVDIVVTRLQPRIRRLVRLATVGASLLFTVGMGYLSLFYVLDSYRMELVTVDLEIPQWLPQLALPFGFALMSFRFLQLGWRILQEAGA